MSAKRKLSPDPTTIERAAKRATSYPLHEVHEAVSTVSALLENQYTELAAATARLQAAEDLFNETHKILVTFKDPIKLNVGGQIFMTGRANLVKYESMLSSMFSGRHTQEKGEDGAYFIDRDPKHFGKILNYLRDGEFELSDDPVARRELLREVDFYGLLDLAAALSEQTFTWTSPTDQCGLFYNIGTTGGTKPYANPTTKGVQVAAVGGQMGNGGNCESFVGQNSRSKYEGFCHDGYNDDDDEDLTKWFAVKLPGTLKPSYYTLSYGGSCCRPSNWRIEGSNDGATWTSLREHSGDRSFKGTARASWSLRTDEWYERFRVISTGPDSSGTCYCFHVGGLELYGSFKRDA